MPHENENLLARIHLRGVARRHPFRRLRARLQRAQGKRWWSHIEYLASDDLQGRNTGSEGHRKAARYVAGEFERFGLKPAGTSGYMQPVKFNVKQIVEDQSSLALVRNGKAEPLTLGDDATLGMRGDIQENTEAGAVFAGYGLKVPEKNYDDLAGLDVRGKIVVFLAGGPASIPGPLKAHYSSGGERWKYLKAAGAVGTATIQNPKAMDIPWARSSLSRFMPSMSLADPSLDESQGLRLAITINAEHADKFFEGTGHTDRRDSRGRRQRPAAAALRPRQVDPRARSTEEVAGGIAERGRADARHGSEIERRVRGALGASRSRRRRPAHQRRQYLQRRDGRRVGRRVAARDRAHAARIGRQAQAVGVVHRGHGRRKRRAGLALLLHASDRQRERSIVADINMDMFLPLFPLHYLEVQGLAESSLGDDIRAVAEAHGVEVQADKEPQRNLFIRSDQYSFIRRGVPALAFKFGYLPGSPEEKVAKAWLRERYHAPSDDLNQPVDKAAAAQFNQIILALAERVANESARPQWKPDSFFRRFASE